MLLELKIKDFGIIDDMDWMLSTGLNIITGETGAGKSLIIDALESLLTGNATDEAIRNTASQAVIEGCFAIQADSRFKALQELLESQGLAAEDHTLWISAIIRRQKPSVVRINGHPVTKSTLRQVSQLLVDIHGQSQHMSLLDTRSHLLFLDAYAHAIDLKKDLNARFFLLKKVESELATLQDKENEAARQAEYLQYQIEEIKKTDLTIEEDDQLEKERKIISQTEKLKDFAGLAYRSLSGSDSVNEAASSTLKLSEAVRALKKLLELDSTLQPQLDYLEKTYYGLTEISREILHYSESLEFNPGRLEIIETRLEIIRNLKRKYGNTIDEILKYRKKAETELSAISASSEKRIQLERERTELRYSLDKQATELSRIRQAAARQMMENVNKELQALDMTQVLFEVAISQIPAPGISAGDGWSCVLGPDGFDNVEFMVSTNPGEPFKPLVKIASTGEISRFTLALKGVLNQTDSIPVLVFDEIDIGVGGRSGDIIGKKLWMLSQNHQVIGITHLPQIAAYADAHYCVIKTATPNRTVSSLQRLNPEQRLNELAVMLVGKGYTRYSLHDATDLLEKSLAWKNSLAGQSAPST